MSGQLSFESLNNISVVQIVELHSRFLNLVQNTCIPQTVLVHFEGWLFPEGEDPMPFVRPKRIDAVTHNSIIVDGIKFTDENAVVKKVFLTWL